MTEYIYKNKLVFYAVFALTLGTVIGFGCFSYSNLMASSEAARWEKHSYLVINEFDTLISTLKDAETGQRGFIITGDRKYLTPYYEALKVVDRRLSILRSLTKDNPRQQLWLTSIESTIRTKLSNLDETVKLRSTEGFQSARTVVMRNLGRNAMVSLREQVARSIREEEQLLKDRSTLEKQYSRRNLYLFLFGGISGLIILLTLYLFLWRELARRIRSERELIANQCLLESQNEELRKARDQRQEMEALLGKYSDLYDLAPAGYFNLDNAGTIRAVNLTGAGFLGIEQSLLVSQRLDSFISDDTLPVFRDFLDRIFAIDAKETCEVVFLKGDSSPIFVLVEAVVSQSREECRAVIIDITARKLAEVDKIKIEEQLQQAQKMESVGRLAGGVAHDFNNMLTVIIGYANLALMDSGLNQALHVHLEEILKAAERSANLTRQLLAFARKQIVVPRVLNLNETVEGMLKLLKRLIGEDIDLDWQPEKDLWSIKVDPSQIDQILANLCVNSCDSIADVGKITIETGNIDIDEGYCAHNSGFVTGEYVRLTVSDNGCGMDKELLAHIFEPFFTTKEIGEGTGLGLASVYGAAKQNNGFVNVYSEPGLGTTFTIYLPRHKDKAVQVEINDAHEPAKRGQETILLVEDEPAILDITIMLLTRQGYTVLAANSPGEAIQLAREHAGEISLLVSDVIMPKMNGRDLANNLQELNPRLKLLFMSGYTYDVIAHHGVFK